MHRLARPPGVLSGARRPSRQCVDGDSGPALLVPSATRARTRPISGAAPSRSSASTPPGEQQQQQQRRRAPSADQSSTTTTTTRGGGPASRGRGGGRGGRFGGGGGRGGRGVGGGGASTPPPLSPLALALREAASSKSNGSVRALATFIEANFDALLLDPHTSADALWRVAEAAAAPATSPAAAAAAFTEGRALQHALPLLYALARRHAGLDKDQESGSSPSSDSEGGGSGGERQGRQQQGRRQQHQHRGRSPSGGSGGDGVAWSARDFARGLTALAALKYTEPDALAALAEASRPLLRGMRARELGRLAAALGGGGLYLGGGGVGGAAAASSSASSSSAMGAGPPAARPAPGWLAAYMAAAAPTLAAGAGFGGGGGGGGPSAATVGDAARCLWGLARLGVRPSAAWMGAYWSAVVPMLMAMAIEDDSGGGGPRAQQQPQQQQQQQQQGDKAQALALLAEALAEARFVAPSGPPTSSSPGFFMAAGGPLAAASGVPAAVASALWPRALLDALASGGRLAALGAPAQAALLSALARVRLPPGGEWLSAFARATRPAAEGYAPWQAAVCLEALGQLAAVEREADGGGQGAAGVAGGVLALAATAAAGGGQQQQQEQQQQQQLPDGLGEWLAAALAAVEAQMPQLGARELASLLRGLAGLLTGPAQGGDESDGDAALARRAAARAVPLLLREAQEKLRRFGAGDIAGLQASAVAVWLLAGGEDGGRGGQGGGGGGAGEGDNDNGNSGPLSGAWLEAWCTEASQKLPVMNAPELVRVLDALAATQVLLSAAAAAPIPADAAAMTTTTDAAGAAAARRAALARDAAAMLESKRSVLEPPEERVAARALEVLGLGG